MTDQRSIDNLSDLLTANIGHNVKVGIAGGDERLATQETGKLLSASPSVVLIQSGEGVVAIPRDKISMMSSNDGAFTYKLPVTNRKATLEIRVVAVGEGMLYLQGLQDGFNWAPSYTVELNGENRMDITAKAILVNSIGDIEGADIRLVSGLPNLNWMKTDDPLLSADLVSGVGLLPGVGLVPNVPYITYDPTDNSVVVQGTDEQIRAKRPAVKPVPMTPAENLFFYHLASISLKKGDRGSYELFEKELPYDHLYNAYLPSTEGWSSSVEAQVFDELDFTNSQENPLAPAAVSVFKDGEIVAQSNFGYTSPHGKGALGLSQASDIHVVTKAEEQSRQRQALVLPDKSVFDLVTEQETVSVENLEKKTVKIQLEKDVNGTIISAEGAPEIVKLASQMDPNSRSSLKWMLTIPAGGKMDINFVYKTLDKVL